MHFSAVLVVLGAALAIASPVRHQALHKKAIAWDVVTDIVYVTVTEGAEPTTPPVETQVFSSTQVVAFVPPQPSTTSTTPPPPPPPPTTTAPPPAPTTEAPAPAPPAPETTKEPEPVVVQAAPTVVAAASAPIVQAATPTDYQSTAVYHHNIHRANHSAPDLSWSDSLAASALVVANTCVFAHKMDVDGGGYGQNLAAFGSSGSNFNSLDLSTLVADSITNQWYNGELGAIPFGVASPSINGPEFLHATQVVWKDSTTVGCATVKCGSGKIFSYPTLYTVCNYGPVGNMMGEFNTQVGRPLGHSTISATIS